MGIQISDQNAWLDRDGGRLSVPMYVKEVVEETSRLARSSSHINQQSGVSVRMSIANLENVVSNAERRALLNNERWIIPRVSDLAHLAPSARGKLELTMTEDDGQEDKLVEHRGRGGQERLYGPFDPKEFRPVVDYFEGGKGVEVGDTLPSARARPNREGPRPPQEGRRFARKVQSELSEPEARDASTAAAAEFILEGLHVNNRLNKTAKSGTTAYRR